MIGHCPRCIGGRTLRDDERTVCIACGWSHDREPDVLTRLLSNVMPDLPDVHRTMGPRVTPDLAAIKARVIAEIRLEATTCSEG